MKYWLLTLVAFSIAACSPTTKNDENLEGAVTIQLPTTDGDKYSLSPVDVFTLKNLRKLSGLAAKFFIDPAVEGGELRGRSPDFKYMRTSSGLIVPTDVLSLQLATVYSHMEKLKALDEAVGAGSINTWPRKVAVNAIYTSPGQGREYNNALYSGQIDAIVFVPYTLKDLPVMVNAGVLGHEHFHSLFYKIVVKPLGDKFPDGQTPTTHDENSQLEQMGAQAPRPYGVEQVESDIFNGVVLRGINEGLADVWGWIYSGDTNFVAKSLAGQWSRKVDLPFGKIQALSDIREDLSKGFESKTFNSSNYAYGIGSQVARAIKGLSVVMNLNVDKKDTAGKLALAKIVYKSLESIKTRVAALKEGEYISPVIALEAFASQIVGTDSLNTAVCERMLSYVSLEDRSELVSCLKVTKTQ